MVVSETVGRILRVDKPVRGSILGWGVMAVHVWVRKYTMVRPCQHASTGGPVGMLVWLTWGVFTLGGCSGERQAA